MKNDGAEEILNEPTQPKDWPRAGSRYLGPEPLSAVEADPSSKSPRPRARRASDLPPLDDGQGTSDRYALMQARTDNGLQKVMHETRETRDDVAEAAQVLTYKMQTLIYLTIAILMVVVLTFIVVIITTLTR